MTTIQLKTGVGAPATLAKGEPAFDTTGKKLYIGDGVGVNLINPTQTNQTQGFYVVGNTTQNSSTTLDARSITFNGLGNITVGYSNGSIQISGSQSLQAQSNQTQGFFALGNTTQNSSTTLDARSLSFNGLGGVTVGYSNGSIQISGAQTVAQTNQTIGLFALGNTTQNSSTTRDARSLSFNGLGDITVGYSNGSIQISGSQSGQALSGSNGSFAFQTATFGNLNGFSFYTSNGSMVGSYTVPSTAGLLSAIKVSAGTASNNLSAITFNDGNGVSFGLNGSVLTASVAAAGGAQTGISGISAGTTIATAGTVSFANGNGVTFGLNGNTLTASVAAAGGAQTGISGLYDGVNSISSGTVSLANANGVTFSINGNTLSASVKTDYLTTQTIQTQNMVSVLGSTGNISFANANGITFGANASTITASHNGLTSQSNQAFSASGGSSAFQTLNFVNGNGATFTNNAGSVGISYTVPTQSAQTVGLYALGNTTQNSSTTLDARTLSFNGLGGITVGYSNGSIQVSGPQTVAQTNQTIGGYAVGNTTGASSSSTLDARSFSIQGAGAASVGFSNGSWIVSAPNAGAGNVTISAGGNSDGLASLVFSNSNGVSFGLNGSTITASVNAGGGGATLSSYLYPEIGNLTAISAPVNGSMSIQRFQAPVGITATDIRLMGSQSMFTSGDSRTFSFVGSHWFGIYTNNAGTLSSLTTGSTAFTSGTYSSNATGSVTGQFMYRLPVGINMSPGYYYIMNNLSTNVISTSTSSQTVGAGACSITMYGISLATANHFRDLGSATGTSVNRIFSGQGVYSVTSNAVPATINMTGINQTGANVLRANLGIMFKG